jgi:hypothetical protein
MLVCGEVDRELEFSTKSNKIVGKISTRDGGTIPREKEE